MKLSVSRFSKWFGIDQDILEYSTEIELVLKLKSYLGLYDRFEIKQENVMQESTMVYNALATAIESSWVSVIETPVNYFTLDQKRNLNTLILQHEAEFRSLLLGSLAAIISSLPISYFMINFYQASTLQLFFSQLLAGVVGVVVLINTDADLSLIKRDEIRAFSSGNASKEWKPYLKSYLDLNTYRYWGAFRRGMEQTDNNPPLEQHIIEKPTVSIFG